MMMAAATTATKTPPTVDAATFKELAYTVVSWVSTHGRFFITHNICTHGRLPWIENASVLSYGSVFIHPLQNRYLGAYPGVSAYVGYYNMVSPLPTIFMDDACLLTHLQLDTYESCM